MPRINAKDRFQIGVRCTPDEVKAAKKLGNGNISQGFRTALRYAVDRNIKPMSLYLMLRAAAEMAAELETASAHDARRRRPGDHASRTNSMP